jgi:hypothetical protein
MMDRRWTLAALTGWAVAGIMFATATRLVRELRTAQSVPMPGPEHVRARVNGYRAPVGPREWGEYLADLGKRLVEAGFDEQATYLFAAGGQLLVADGGAA